jgi:iron complex outermembrane receptor protein
VYANVGWQVSDTSDVRVFATYVDNDERLPGALTRAEVDADPDQASAAARGGDYGKVVRTGRVAAKATWAIGATGSFTAGLSFFEKGRHISTLDSVIGEGTWAVWKHIESAFDVRRGGL